MPAYSEEQLVMEALDDSHQAFGQLVKQYQYRVLRTIASIISDEQAAQDVAQETFLVAWTDLQKLKEKHKFGRWLNQIAVNLSKLWLREQRKHQGNVVFLEEDTNPQMQELEYQSEKLRQEVWEAIDGLSEDHKEAVILHYISGYSYKEISEMLSVPFSTIVGRIQQARNQLRKEFLDMVTQLQLEIDSTVHKFLKEHAKQNGVSIEGLIIRLIERYKRDLDNPEIAVRKVSMGDVYGAPSPDGRYLAMTNWKTFNLDVRDLATGEIREITKEGLFSSSEPHRLSYAPVWSPDSKQIAHAFFNEGYHELRIVGLNGSEPRVLWSGNDELLGIAPYDWSSDGKSILGGANRANDTREIVLVSVADGSVRTLKSLEGHWPRFDKMSFSPDGRYIVYDRPVKENNGFRDLFLLATDGSGEEISLVGHPDSHDFSPLWAPDEKSIVFVSNRGPIDATSLWFTRVIDGKQMGEPQLVMRGAGGIRPLGFTREGSLYYGISCGDRSWDIHIASLNVETGELLSQPTRLSSEGSNTWPAWSPDGSNLAYVSRRASPKGSRYALTDILVIRSMETGEEREILPEASLYTGSLWIPLGLLCWSPDGRSILCGGHYTAGIHLIDIQTGDITTIVEFHPRIRIWGLACSPDGKRIFYIRQRTEKGEWPSSIMAHDLATGEEQELCPGGRHYNYALVVSPDGRKLAFPDGREHEGTHIKIVPTAGGEAREFVSLHNEADEIRESVSPVAWTPDGHYLLFKRSRELPDGSPDDRPPPELWRIPAEGGEPQKLLTAEGLGRNLLFHPDGQRIAYCRATGGPGQNELWVMENLLTTFAADK